MGPPEECGRGQQLHSSYDGGPQCGADRRSFACSMRSIVATAPATTRPGSTIAPVQKAAWLRKTFEYGTWGGEIRSEFAPQPGDIVALEHWCSSGFANTDLDLQLKKHGIQRLIIIGLDCTHVRRVDRSLRRGTWLRRHDGQGRDRGLFGRGDARRTRRQHPKLCQCRREHQ